MRWQSTWILAPIFVHHLHRGKDKNGRWFWTHSLSRLNDFTLRPSPFDGEIIRCSLYGHFRPYLLPCGILQVYSSTPNTTTTTTTTTTTAVFKPPHGSIDETGSCRDSQLTKHWPCRCRCHLSRNACLGGSKI